MTSIPVHIFLPKCETQFRNASQGRLALAWIVRLLRASGTRLATVHSIQWMLVLNRPKRSEDGAVAETSAPFSSFTSHRIFLRQHNH